MAMMGPVTSDMAFKVASRGDSPASILRSTFSTTTMASSTTMPMASTRPNSDKLFKEKPIAAMAPKVPINETGTAKSGMMEARQLCRKTTTTSTTKIIASSKVCRTARIDSLVERSGLSPRHCQRRFAAQVGLSPKLYARTIRFDAALTAHRNDPVRPWTEIVHEAGYFDQAHFVRECHALVGVAPSHFIGDWENIFSLHG